MKAKQPTYTAFYQEDHSAIIYRRKPNDGTLADLPNDAQPSNDSRSTYFRLDGGDRFEWAWFVTNVGQVIIIQRD